MDRIVIIASLIFITTFSWAREPLSELEMAEIITEFQYPSNYNETLSNQSGGSWDSCWTYRKTFETNHPASVDPLTVNITMYMPNRQKIGDSTVPAVLMLPPTGGVNLLDRKMAKTFCSAKMSAIIIENDFANIESQAKGPLLDPADHELSYHRATAAVKAVMQFVADDEQLDQERVGLFGVSLGGILGAFAMATQPEIAAGYLIVAGGDVPNILAHSEQDEVSRIRRKRMKEQGFNTRDEYEIFLREHMVLDPMDLTLTMLPETLHMVISRRDDNVPTENQEALHLAFGEPEATYSNSGHVNTVINSLLFKGDRRRVSRFFKKRFEMQNPRIQAFAWMDTLEMAAAY